MPTLTPTEICAEEGAGVARITPNKKNSGRINRITFAVRIVFHPQRIFVHASCAPHHDGGHAGNASSLHCDHPDCTPLEIT